ATEGTGGAGFSEGPGRETPGPHRKLAALVAAPVLLAVALAALTVFLVSAEVNQVVNAARLRADLLVVRGGIDVGALLAAVGGVLVHIQGGEGFLFVLHGWRVLCQILGTYENATVSVEWAPWIQISLRSMPPRSRLLSHISNGVEGVVAPAGPSSTVRSFVVSTARLMGTPS